MSNHSVHSTEPTGTTNHVRNKIERGVRLLFACIMHWRIVFKPGILKTRMVLRKNQLLLFNVGQQQLARCSLNANGNREIISNHTFLAEHPHPSFPCIRGDLMEGKRVLSREALLVGRPPSVEEVTDELKRGAIRLLNGLLYDRHKSQERFDLSGELRKYDQHMSQLPRELGRMVEEIRSTVARGARPSGHAVTKTMIHGDLTYRNLIVSGDSIGFCDFSRCGVSFAEFDIYLMAIDAITYRRQPTTFAKFLDHVQRFATDGDTLQDVEYLYTINAAFAVNRIVDFDLRRLFLYRTLVLSLEYLKGRTKEMYEIVRQVRAGLQGTRL